MTPAPRVFVITGCASGIGRHLALTLGRAGQRLIITDINHEALAVLTREHGLPEERVLARRLDVRDAGAWQEIIDLCVSTFGRIDVLMNVAGYLRPGWLHETEAAEAARHLDVNAMGTILGTRAAAIQMVRQGAGHIINIGSLASLAPVPGLCLYSASKFAVRGFSLAAAQELRPHGVHVSLVCPDAVRTPMLDLQVGRAEAALTFSGARALTVEEIAEVILGEVLRERPMERLVPAGRGLLARMATCAPALMSRLAPLLARRGLRAQARLRAGTPSPE